MFEWLNKRKADTELGGRAKRLRRQMYVTLGEEYYETNRRVVGEEIARHLREDVMPAGLAATMGLDLTLPGVIIFKDYAGREYVPAFQVGTRELQFILGVNLRLLGANFEPWQVANWWLEPHPILTIPPVDVVGQRQRLLRALDATLGC